ncbi:MAG TPA: hypothetical protein PKK96_06525 [Anaerolineales bacterium]|nr:hypothetical protein [Anaerolineales bacterium]HMR99478.1 hypothetical protein [Anaerolineales bacterium]HNS60642.1 hypothetical protein [Anaerolineales bacterium]
MFKPKYKTTHTLLNLRGRVKVSGGQDFDSIRKQVKANRTTKRGKPQKRR